MARALVPSKLPRLTEKQFQGQVIQLARMLGWMVYHTYDSRRSDPGFPDLTMVRPSDRVIFAEIKTDKGKASIEQAAWLEALKSAGAEAYLWRPSDWREIEAALKRRV